MLIVVDKKGEIITTKGCEAVLSDPDGEVCQFSACTIDTFVMELE